MSTELQRILESAIEDHRRGDVVAASAKYATIIATQPDTWDVVSLYATSLLQLGRLDESIAEFRRLVAVRPVADVQNNLGVALQRKGDWEAAARAYQAAIEAQPDYDRAAFNLACLMETRRLFADAEKCLRHAIRLQPQNVVYTLRLVSVLEAQDEWNEAERLLREASATHPDNLDLRVNFGYALLKLERLDAAAETYRQILQCQPDYPEIHNNLSYVLERQGHLDEALAAANRALELRPDYPEGHNNLGTIYRSMHRIEEAAVAFRRAISLNPEFALAEFNFGTTQLLAGNYKEGWSGYRQHIRLTDSAPPAPAGTEWDGGVIAGKRLLVYADQGFGDAIQFSRFLEGCKRQSGAQIIFRCQPALVRVFRGLRGVDELVDESAPPPPSDLQVPLGSLPALLGVTIGTAGKGVPYIDAPQALSDAIKDRLGPNFDGTLKVGVVWQGNPRQTRDVLRSCPLEKLSHLFRLKGAQFVGLQTGETGRDQLMRLEENETIVDVGDLLGDFAETAALLAAIDLLITVDTAIAHLAGAMGLPVWTLLCHTPDWRWHLQRSDSPWYPTMRLFRQPRWGDWDAVVTEVTAALRTRVEEVQQ